MLPETNSSPLKIDGWKTTFLLKKPMFRGYVSFREGKMFFSTSIQWELWDFIGIILSSPHPL